jgi:hypothetical protein
MFFCSKIYDFEKVFVTVPLTFLCHIVTDRYLSVTDCFLASLTVTCRYWPSLNTVRYLLCYCDGKLLTICNGRGLRNDFKSNRTIEQKFQSIILLQSTSLNFVTAPLASRYQTNTNFIVILKSNVI